MSSVYIPRRPRSMQFVRFVANMIKLGTNKPVRIVKRKRGYSIVTNDLLTSSEKLAIMAVLMNNKQDRDTFWLVSYCLRARRYNNV